MTKAISDLSVRCAERGATAFARTPSPNLLYRTSRGIAAMLALLVWGTTSDAQDCAPRDGMVATLAERYGEIVQMSAVNTDGVLVEFFAAKDSGTWTMLASDGTGDACVLDMGTGWEIEKPREPT